MTPESFAHWKKTRLDKKAAEMEAVKKSKESQNAAGKVTGMSGRDLWDYRPEWFAEEDDGEDVAAEEEGEGWDLEKMRRETEEAQEKEEESRMEAMRQGFDAVNIDS